jgi:purine-cytosine permease-like protein
MALANEALYRDEVLVVEPHGIEHIKDEERHGTLAGQFNVWFAANMHLSTLVLGALGLEFGLGFWPTVLACALGNFLGALGNSACVAMGPRLGMPQMPMSRSAFGYRGNYVPAFLAWLGFIGWFTVDNILGGTTAQQFFHTPYLPTMVVFWLVTLAIAIYGYNLVHRWERYLTWISALVFAVLTVFALAHGLGPDVATKDTGVKFWDNFLLEFSIMFSYTVSWAPYAVIAIGSISSNVLNMYSGAMSGLTWDMPLKRTGAALVIAGIGLVLSILFGGPKFVGFFKDFLFILVYWVTPWIGIIAIDFYLFHRSGQDYRDVLEFYKRNGVFGSVRWPGLLALLVGIAVSVPFMAPGKFTGPIAKAMGGADISYLVSFVVAGLIYLVTGRPKAPALNAARADD